MSLLILREKSLGKLETAINEKLDEGYYCSGDIKEILVRQVYRYKVYEKTQLDDINHEYVLYQKMEKREVV